MWMFFKYILFCILTILLSISLDLNYIRFGLLTEILWLLIYITVSLSGSYLSDTLLLSLPFFILTLTAVEVVVFWSLLLLNINE